MAAAASSGGAASGGGAGGFESFAPLAGANYVLSIATELAGAKDAAAVAFAGKAADLRALVPSACANAPAARRAGGRGVEGQGGKGRGKGKGRRIARPRALTQSLVLRPYSSSVRRARGGGRRLARSRTHDARGPRRRLRREGDARRRAARRRHCSRGQDRPPRGAHAAVRHPRRPPAGRPGRCVLGDLAWRRGAGCPSSGRGTRSPPAAKGRRTCVSAGDLRIARARARAQERVRDSRAARAVRASQSIDYGAPAWRSFGDSHTP